MLANAKIIRSTLALALATFLLFITVSNIDRVAAQSSLPPMPAANAPIIDYQNRYLPTYGKAGMVVSPEKLAGDIGLDMLKQGGNAVDAAVATGSVPPAVAAATPPSGLCSGRCGSACPSSPQNCAGRSRGRTSHPCSCRNRAQSRP